MFEGNNVFDKDKLDFEFAEKLKKESPTQFNTLIKMHLSFLLDLNEYVNIIYFCETPSITQHFDLIFPEMNQISMTKRNQRRTGCFQRRKYRQLALRRV